MGGCQDGCEWRSEAFVKIHFFLGGGVGLGVGLVGGQVDVKKREKDWGVGLGGGGCQDGCEWRSEAFVKIHFFLGGGGLGWWGVRWM